MRNLTLTKIVISISLLIFNNYGTANGQTNKNKKIIIIGAGAAGIAAAAKLYENGFTDLTILEAEDRIGGRLYTTKFGDYSVDLGGQWVHGQKNNVAFELAYPLGLLDTNNNTEFNEVLLDSSGKVVSNTVNKLLLAFIGKYFLEHVPTKTHAFTMSHGEFMEKLFDDEFRNLPEVLNHKRKLLHYLEIATLSADSGDSWYDVAIRDENGYFDREGDQKVNWKTRGYGMILDILLKRYPYPEQEIPILDKTVFNCEVTSIDYSNTIFGEQIILTAKNGQVYKADHVIVTVSLGVLKKNHETLFNPGLPNEKINAIEGLGFGSAGKVYLLFEKPFWKLDGKKSMHYGFIWNQDELEAREGDPERRWTLGVLGASTVEHKPNLLEFYIASRYSKAMETIPENKIFDHCVELLERFMGKTYQISKPLAIMRTQWYTNPHFKGAYSYRDVESDKRRVYPGTLEEPIHADYLTILFAGEATSTHRFSTADGAIESGQQAANRLINYYDVQSSYPKFWLYF